MCDLSCYLHRSYRCTFQRHPHPDPSDKVIRSTMYELSCYLHRSYRGMFQRLAPPPPSPTKLSRPGYISYQVRHVWVIILFVQKLPWYVSTTPPPPPSPTKFLGPGYISYQVYEFWVTMLFTRKLTKDISSPLPPHCQSYQDGVHKLWSLRFVSYHAIHTKVTGGYLINPHSPWQSYQDRDT